MEFVWAAGIGIGFLAFVCGLFIAAVIAEKLMERDYGVQDRDGDDPVGRGGNDH